jgi:hypothetical protein
MQLGGLLEQFNTYAKNSYIASVRLSVPEIRAFLEGFFTRRTFFINDLMYYGATKKNSDGEPLFVFTNEDFTTDDYIEAVLPEVIALYTKAYGTPSDRAFDRQWPPTPFKAETEAQIQQAAIIKQNIQEYNQKTLPFRLSKTMHHPLQTISFSFTSGKIIPNGKKGEVIITSPEQIEEFVSSKKFHSLDGGTHEGLRDIWFEALNEDASNPKFGWVDIDNPANLPDKDLKAVVKDISKRLEKAERKHIIMFTGRNYQIWFAPREGERFNHATDIKNIAAMYGAQAGAWVGGSVLYQKQAIAKQLVYVDTSVYTKNQKLGFFFGMHFKPSGLDNSTGLVRVPVKRSELSGFNPLVDAHPQVVLERFTELKARVDMFCQLVEMGEGFPFRDKGYPCYRTARGNNDTSHELVNDIVTWKSKPRMSEISKRVVGEELLQAEEIVLTPKLDGWLGCMAFNTMGKFVINGQKLDKLQKYEGMNDSIQSERQRAVMTTKGGLFSWDNYLTHAFEDACRSIGVTEAIVTGEIVTYNDLGQIAGRDAVTSVLNRQEEDSEVDGVSNHDRISFRKLKFVIHDVISFDGSEVSREVPITQRLALMSEVKNDRISVIHHEVISEDLTINFEAFWKKYKEEANNEGLVAYAYGRRYKIKSKFTLDAVIIGIDMSSKTWRDQKDMLSVVVIAVSKNTSKGPTFVAFQKVGNFKMTDEERRTLFHKVLGEQTGDWPTPEGDRSGFTNAIPVPLPYEPNFLVVDPKVVVEVEYESLGNKLRPAIAFYRQQKKNTGAEEIARGYSMYAFPKPLASRRLNGTPVIIRERPDKSSENPSDISHKQAEGAGGLEISAGKQGSIGSEELENPSPIKVTHVRTNPMYGYARGPRYIGGVGLGSAEGDKYPAGHIAMGGEFGDRKATLEQEFTGLPTQGKGKWKPNYKPIWDQARQHPQTGLAYYPEMTGFSAGAADAIFDERGANIPGSKEDSVDYQQTSQFSLKNLLSDEYHEDTAQGIEEAKQLGRAFGKEVNHMPGTKESQHMLAGLVNKDIDEIEKQKLVTRKIRSKGFNRSNNFNALDRGIRDNPPSSNSEWNRRASQYRNSYNEWDKTPQPKPDWKTLALKNYEAWELALLEKGRQLMDAEDNFTYSPSEEAIIHGRFPGNEAEGQHIFAAIEFEAGDDDEFEDEDTDSP